MSSVDAGRRAVRRHAAGRCPQRQGGPTVSVCLLWAFASRVPSIARAQQVLEEAGIDMASLVDARTRVPSSVSLRLLEVALEELADPAFGLRLGTGSPPGAFGMVEQLARFAPTLRESIECYSRYCALIQESAELKLVEEGPLALVVYRANEPQPRVVTDFVLSYALCLMRRDVADGFDAEEIQLSVPPPSYRDAYPELLGIPARFDCGCDAIVIRREDLSRPVGRAREPIYASLEAKVRRAMARLERSGSFAARARVCVRAQLARGSVRMEETARRLHVSASTLRRRLGEDGTSHREILNSMRAEAARRDLLHTRLAPAEIAARLGFAHVNSFYKAFKRWTGLSPREYRARHADHAT